MPSWDQVVKSEYTCPKCYEPETYVNEQTQLFLCPKCDYERPVDKVAQIEW